MGGLSPHPLIMAKENERESTIYARMTNPSGLWQAAEILHQEQAQIKAPCGNIRVRMERKDGSKDWEYTMTTKHFSLAKGGVKDACEDTEKISAKQYQMFKSVCKDYMRKTRFVFLIEKLVVEKPGVKTEVELKDVKYEVDVFYKENGEASEYVKIDVELQNIKPQLDALGIDIGTVNLTARVSKLPFGPVAAFVDDGSGGKMREFISMIYETQFLRKLTPQ